MTFPVRGTTKDNCRNTFVALAHHKVSKSGELINNRLFGNLKDSSKEISRAPVIMYSWHPGPSDSNAGLPTAKCPSTGIGQDHSDISTCFRKEHLPNLFSIFHRVRRKGNHDIAFHITVINPCPDTNMTVNHL